MTHIVNPTRYPTKKAFKEAVRDNPHRVMLDDPSIFDPISGSVEEIMSKRSMITVTNHPKRSWFAQITKSDKGIKVS